MSILSIFCIDRVKGVLSPCSPVLAAFPLPLPFPFCREDSPVPPRLLPPLPLPLLSPFLLPLLLLLLLPSLQLLVEVMFMFVFMSTLGRTHQEVMRWLTNSESRHTVRRPTTPIRLVAKAPPAQDIKLSMRRDIQRCGTRTGAGREGGIRERKQLGNILRRLTARILNGQNRTMIDP